MSVTRDELQSYYEEEAARGLRRTSVRGPRLEFRDRFIAQLRREGRGRVVDLGAGPGRDAGGFAEAGLDVIGIDLAHGNGVLARGRDLTVIQASVLSPPFRTGAFPAGWCMSVLMHLSESEMVQAVQAMAEVLAPGSPLWIGMWGGEDAERVDESIPGQRRPFFSRPLTTNREIIDSVGSIESADDWDLGETGRYHAIAARIGG